MHVFQCTETLVSLQLDDLGAHVDIQLIAPENRNGGNVGKGQLPHGVILCQHKAVGIHRKGDARVQKAAAQGGNDLKL